MTFSKNTISNISFFLLIPCCFFYYVFLSLKIIPPLPLGYYSVIASLLVIPLCLNYLIFNTVKIKYSTIFDLLFFIYLIYYIAIVAVNFVPTNGKSSLFMHHVGVIVFHLTTFLTFRNINLESKIFFNLNTIFIFLICITILVLTKNSAFILTIEGIGLPKDRASYQFIALIYIMCSIIFLSGNYKRGIIFIFYIMSIMALYFNGARSELIVFLLIIILAEFIKSEKRLWSLVISIASISTLVGILFSYRDTLNKNRVVELLINTTQNQSGNSRTIMTNNAIETIQNYPMFGGMLSYEKGSYAHNILSIWVDLGVFGFILYSTMLMIPFLYASYLVIIKKRRTKIIFTMTCFIYASIFLLIFVKSFYYLLIPASFGLFSNYLSTKTILIKNMT